MHPAAISLRGQLIALAWRIAATAAARLRRYGLPGAAATASVM
jgi:hypothetical protein